MSWLLNIYGNFLITKKEKIKSLAYLVIEVLFYLDFFKFPEILSMVIENINNSFEIKARINDYIFVNCFFKKLKSLIKQRKIKIQDLQSFKSQLISLHLVYFDSYETDSFSKELFE